jgi:two-component system KDP operon response regulator KdpE
MKVLLIEDSDEIVNSLRLCFKVSWPDVAVVTSNGGARGIEMVESESPDIIILDLGLPDMDGMEVLGQIRRFSDIPVIILSVRSQELDEIGGLESGADDYITKPFSPLHLLARVRAVLRRAQHFAIEKATPPFVAGGLTVNFESRQVSFNGKSVELTRTEYNLLCYLIANRNRVVTHAAIVGELWGEECDDADAAKTFISQLRRKLDSVGADSANLIVSARGVGYKFISSA